MKPKQQIAVERNEFDRLRDAYQRDAADRMNAIERRNAIECMNAIVNPSLGIAGAGANNQASIFGNAPSYTRVETMFDPNRQLRTQIIRADNGYILLVHSWEAAAASRVLVAASIEELRDLITSELVTQSLEK